MGTNTQYQIQWFPGHMAKTRRLMQENLKLVDIVIELRDARIPYSSKNPEIEKLIGDKPRLILLNKASLADPAVSRACGAVQRQAASIQTAHSYVCGAQPAVRGRMQAAERMRLCAAKIRRRA